MIPLVSLKTMFVFLVMLLFIKNSRSNELLKDYPYVVGIGITMSDSEVGPIFIDTCTGSIVNANWVLTVGDCIAQEEDYFVSIASYNNGTPSVTKVNVTERFLHPGYKRPTFATNIGLVAIPEGTVPILPKLSLDDYWQSFGLPVDYIGFWDKSKETNGTILQRAEFVINRCHLPSKSLVCAEKRSHNAESSNWFTFGGPLISEGTITGLYVGQIDTNLGRFVPISVNYHWIEKVMHENMHSLRFSVALSMDTDK